MSLTQDDANRLLGGLKGEVVAKVVVDDETSYFGVNEGTVEVVKQKPAKVDLIIRADAQSIQRILSRQLSVDNAQMIDRLSLSGEMLLIEDFKNQF